MTKYTRTKWYVHRILESTPWTSTLQFTDLAQFITSWVAEVSRTESKGWRGGPGWHFSLVLPLSLWLLFPSPSPCGALCGCRSSSSRALCPLPASCSSSSLTNPLLVYGGKQMKLEGRSSCWASDLSIGRHISEGGTQPCHTRTVQTPGSYLASLCPTSPTCLSDDDTSSSCTVVRLAQNGTWCI